MIKIIIDNSNNIQNDISDGGDGGDGDEVENMISNLTFPLTSVKVKDEVLIIRNLFIVSIQFYDNPCIGYKAIGWCPYLSKRRG